MSVVTHLRRLAHWLSVRLEQFAAPRLAVPLVPWSPMDEAQLERLRGVFLAPAPDARRAEVEAVVHAAYLRCGQPDHLWSMDYDLSRTGKLFEVLHYAAMTLDVDHRVRTVGDLVDILLDALETK